jgi:hypothetical protein
MTKFRKPLAVLVVGIAVSALATPSYAQRSEEMSSARVQALQTCNKEASKFKQYTWGDTEMDTYRRA